MIGSAWLWLTSGCDSANVIEGKVVDVWGNPIAGATVMVVGGEERPLTDANGRYELAVVPGSLQIKAGARGYIQDHAEIVVEQTARDVQGPLFELYPKPEQPGMYLLGPHRYQPLPPTRVRTVGNTLTQFRGVADRGDARATGGPVRVVYHTTLRQDEIRALDLRLRRLDFVADTQLPGPMGPTDVRVNLWVDTGDVKLELTPLNSKTDYLLTFPAELAPGAYAFETQGLLSGRPEDVAAVPPELRVVFPFEVEP